MKKFLHLEGSLSIPKDPKVLQDLVESVSKGVGNWFRMAVTEDGNGLQLIAVDEPLIAPGEEHEFLDFLEALGQKYPGKIVGEFEVWWPMAVESGPQWWQLGEDGKIYITESDIIRGDKKVYKETKS